MSISQIHRHGKSNSGDQGLKERDNRYRISVKEDEKDSGDGSW